MLRVIRWGLPARPNGPVSRSTSRRLGSVIRTFSAIPTHAARQMAGLYRSGRPIATTQATRRNRQLVAWKSTKY
jgi:hypothetical protein